jgi:hypothetical protein
LLKKNNHQQLFSNSSIGSLSRFTDNEDLTFAASVIQPRPSLTALIPSLSIFKTSIAMFAATSQHLAHSLPFTLGSCDFFL